MLKWEKNVQIWWLLLPEMAFSISRILFFPFRATAYISNYTEKTGTKARQENKIESRPGSILNLVRTWVQCTELVWIQHIKRTFKTVNQKVIYVMLGSRAHARMIW